MNKTPRCSSMAVANWFIENASPIDPLKLQKLIYFAHGWYLALRDQPLIDEFVEAWEYGPVVPSVYHEFKEYGNRPILKPGTAVERRSDGTLWFVTPRVPNDDEFVVKLLRKIADVYGRYSGLQLSTETHKPDSPWAKVRSTSFGRKGTDIPDEEIETYFKQLIPQSTNV